MASEYLKRTPTSIGNRGVWTASLWHKINSTGAFFGAGDGSSASNSSHWWYNADQLGFSNQDGSDYVVSTRKNRDFSSWSNYMIVVNTGATEPYNRVVFYENGVRNHVDTTSGYTNPTQYEQLNWINQLVAHHIGARNRAGANTFGEGGYFDFFFIDGQALAPDVFGFYKDGDGYMSSGTSNATDFKPGQWMPHAPSKIKKDINRRGGFGVNGFYLPMNDSSNPGADFHTTPNSIIKLKGEDLPQPRNGAPTTSDSYVSQLRPQTGELFNDGVVDFGGAGDRNALQDSGNGVDLGTGEFTVEAFVYHTILPQNSLQYIFMTTAQGNPNAFAFAVENDRIVAGSHAGSFSNSTKVEATFPVGSLKTGQWYHYAACRSGNTLRLFIDGKMMVEDTSHTENYNNTSAFGCRVGSEAGDGASSAGYKSIKGFMSNVRVVNGTALYTSNFTPPTSALTAVTNTILLCCQSPTSVTAAAVSPGTLSLLTEAGDTPAAAARNELDASIVLAVPGISTSTSANLVTNGTFETVVDGETGYDNGDGTVDGWNKNSIGSLSITNGTSGRALRVSQPSANAGVTYGQGSISLGTLTSGKRYLLKYSGLGGTAKKYPAICTNANTSNTDGSFLGLVEQIGAYSTAAEEVQKYFEPSSTAEHWLVLQLGNDGAGTYHDFDNIVVKQEDAPRDYSADIKGSGTNKTLTANGNAGVGYELGGYYGSALKFDGTGDSLTTTDNISDYNFGTGDFTVETWFKKDANGSNGYDGLAQLYNTPNGNGTNGWFLEASASRGILFYSDDGTGYNLQFDGASSVNLGQWQHLAICREDNVATMFLNGVAVGISTNYASNITGGTTLRLGTYGSSSNFYFNGDIQDFRIYKGVAKYKGGFDVPKPYTPVGIESFRAVTDTCKNNFSVLNPLNPTSGTLSNGNLSFYRNGKGGSTSTFGVDSGKFYVEAIGRVTGNGFGFGFVQGDYDASGSGSDIGASATSFGVRFKDTNTEFKPLGGSSTTYSGQTNSDSTVIAFAVDFDTGAVTFYRNGTSIHTVTLSLPAGKFFAAIASETSTQEKNIHINFGQNPTFSGQVTAGTYTDSNGKGLFKYEPPTGFLALCEDNLPTPAIADPGDHFKCVLYRGDENRGHKITGVGFQPDLVWIKNRTTATSHGLYDTIRGPEYDLRSDSTAASTQYAGYGVASFDEDGFTVQGNGTVSNSADNFVAWCWKAGGSPVPNTDGTLSTQVSVNQTAGFSVATYTTPDGAATTFGHGLGKKPAFALFKARNNTGNWAVYHQSLGTNTIRLSTTGAEDTSSDAFNNTAPTDTLMYLGTWAGTNGSNINWVSYLWAEIEGFSKFGSYVGNASADGTFVYCGFKPAFVITKRTDGTSNWLIHDSSRDPVNPVMGALYTNNNSAEGSAVRVDFVSNGFKHRNADGGTANNYANNYIFMAFAESPFQTANAK